MIKEHDSVVLAEDLPSEKLKGDIGTIVHIHGKDEGYEVEFTTLAGQTLTVVALSPQQVRPISPRDLAHVRELAAA